MKEDLIFAYFAIAGINGLATFLWQFTDYGETNFENFWDWLVYNLLWPKQFFKYFWKHLTKL